MNFNGKTAMITGASVGIGRACAIKLAENGANLVLLDMNYDGLEKVKSELSSYPVEVLIYECDVTDEDKVNSIVKESTEHFGKIDILVNNAALWRYHKPFLEIPSEDWRKYLDVNIMGVVHCTKAVLPKMIENKYGRVINVASVAGVYGNANMVHYSATKSAVITMTKALAREVVADGVLVNSVSPGSVSPSDNPDVNYVQESTLSFMGRTGSDMENANVICFLASDEASYISGENIMVDGCRKKMG